MRGFPECTTPFPAAWRLLLWLWRSAHWGVSVCTCVCVGGAVSELRTALGGRGGAVSVYWGQWGQSPLVPPGSRASLWSPRASTGQGGGCLAAQAAAPWPQGEALRGEELGMRQGLRPQARPHIRAGVLALLLPPAAPPPPWREACPRCSLAPGRTRPTETLLCAPHGSTWLMNGSAVGSESGPAGHREAQIRARAIWGRCGCSRGLCPEAPGVCWWGRLAPPPLPRIGAAFLLGGAWRGGAGGGASPAKWVCLPALQCPAGTLRMFFDFPC